MVKFLKWMFCILLILNITSCKDSKSPQTINNKIKKEKKSNWIEDEFKKQFHQRGEKDSVKIFGLPLKKLPDYFYDYQEIKYLRIDCTDRNCITELSPKISKLINLEILILSKTSLKDLPKEIGQLEKLRELRILGGGQLEYLPKEIGDLKELEILDVWRNELHEIPEKMIGLKKIKTMFLGENEFTDNYIKKLKIRMPTVQIRMNR